MYSPLWKITHQNPSVLCTPPFEKSPIKAHRFYVLPPLKNHCFWWAFILGWAFISVNTVIGDLFFHLISGAGKSTLMNVLTSRNLSDNLLIDGAVRVNGTELGSSISKISGYVQQDDIFFPTLSVREHMEFQAALRIGRLLTKEERLQRIDELLNLVKKHHNFFIIFKIIFSHFQNFFL